MDEDEELYREMNPEDPFYMGDEEDDEDCCAGSYADECTKTAYEEKTEEPAKRKSPIRKCAVVITAALIALLFFAVWLSSR